MLWDAVRTAVDNRGQTGLFILTSSASVDESKIMHTGTGRIARLKMLPMSLFESGDSNGTISLKRLFSDAGYDIDGATSDLSLEELVFVACRGGWPASVGAATDAEALLTASDYMDDVCESGCSRVDGVRRDPAGMRALLRSYARNVSTLATNTSILHDIQTRFADMSEPTLYSYLKALTRLFVIDEVPAWRPSIRSASAMRAGSKKEFTDPSMAVAALGLSPERLLSDLITFGSVFETLCIRDLKVYSSALGGTVSHYRDRYGLAADCVLRLGNDRYALIQFRLGSRQIQEGSSQLLELQSLIRKRNEEHPAHKLREPDLLVAVSTPGRNGLPQQGRGVRHSRRLSPRLTVFHRQFRASFNEHAGKPDENRKGTQK